MTPKERDELMRYKGIVDAGNAIALQAVTTLRDQRDAAEQRATDAESALAAETRERDEARLYASLLDGTHKGRKWDEVR